MWPRKTRNRKERLKILTSSISPQTRWMNDNLRNGSARSLTDASNQRRRFDDLFQRSFFTLGSSVSRSAAVETGNWSWSGCQVSSTRSAVGSGRRWSTIICNVRTRCEYQRSRWKILDVHQWWPHVGVWTYSNCKWKFGKKWSNKFHDIGSLA